MAKLTHAQIKAHAAAEALLNTAHTLNLDDIIDVICDWHEGATHSNAATSAFFTPWELATSFAIEVPGPGRVLDLCAGIGTLSVATLAHHYVNRDKLELTLVELDERYCEVARRLLPDATIICGSIFDPAVRHELARNHYDVAISNPPYGSRNIANGKGPRYTGSKCEYAVIDIASDLADYGVFIIPQSSVPFKMSGVPNFEALSPDANRDYANFSQQTQIELRPSCGIDTSFAENLWRGTSIRTEVTTTDFLEAQQRRLNQAPQNHEQGDLFSLAA